MLKLVTVVICFSFFSFLSSSLIFNPPASFPPFLSVFGVGGGNLEPSHRLEPHHLSAVLALCPRCPQGRQQLGVPAAQPTGSRSEATLAMGAGSVSRSRGPCQGQRIPWEGANRNRPKRGRHETGRGDPIAWASFNYCRSVPIQGCWVLQGV